MFCELSFGCGDNCFIIDSVYRITNNIARNTLKIFDNKNNE